MREEKNWYVVYTKLKNERRVAETLEKKQIATYLPETSKVQYLFGRRRVVPVPLIPSLLFVFSSEQELLRLIGSDGIAGVLYKFQKPAIIRGREVVAMQRFLATHHDITIDKVPLGCTSYVGDTNTSQEDDLSDDSSAIEHLFLPSLGYCLSALAEAVRMNKVA